MKGETRVVTNLAGSRPFLRIRDDQKPGVAPAYGGNQLWLSTINGMRGGCGTVTAANILAHLSFERGNKWKGLYAYPDLTKSHFIQHMEEVYQVVKPISLVLARRWLPTVIQKRTPYSLGIPGIAFFSRRVLRYAGKKGVDLQPVWRDRRKRAHYNTSLQMSDREAADYIRQGLESGCPVALLNTCNPHLEKIQYCLDNKSGTEVINSFQRHWVTITALMEEVSTGSFSIQVSSWGSSVNLNLSEFWRKGYSGLIYFQ